MPGITLYMQPVQDLTIDANVSRTQYQFVLEGTDQTVLANLAAKLVDKLKTIPHLEQVSADTQNQGLAAYIQVDRDTAGRLGISMATVDNAIEDAFAQRIVSTIYTQSNQYRVILEASPTVLKSPNALQSIYLPSTAGTAVPLSAIATIRQQPSALQVSHVGQFPAATISFNLAKGVALGTAVNADQGGRTADRRADLGHHHLPRRGGGVPVLPVQRALADPGGDRGDLHRAGRALRELHPPGDHPVHPALAAIGALLALLITGQDLGVIGIIGIILLFGIVKKNAIMMIDFALDAERNEGMTPTDAIHQAALLRFRPIMMTTMAALLGALPLMLGGGMGAELRFPLGVSIVGGLLASQLLTLFTTPVIYIAFDNIATRFGKKDPESPVRYERDQEGRGQFPDPEGYPS